MIYAFILKRKSFSTQKLIKKAMKKFILSTIVAMLAILVGVYESNAQKWEDGSTVANIGIGTIYGFGLVGSVDKGIADDISIGVGASVSRYGYLGFNTTYFSVGGRGSYHLGKILEDAGIKMDKTDLYVGLNLSYFFGSEKDTWIGYRSRGGLGFGGHGGLRYALNDKLNLMLEGGYPYSSIGLSFKLK